MTQEDHPTESHSCQSYACAQSLPSALCVPFVNIERHLRITGHLRTASNRKGRTKEEGESFGGNRSYRSYIGRRKSFKIIINILREQEENVVFMK